MQSHLAPKRASHGGCEESENDCSSSCSASAPCCVWCCTALQLFCRGHAEPCVQLLQGSLHMRTSMNYRKVLYVWVRSAAYRRTAVYILLRLGQRRRRTGEPMVEWCRADARIVRGHDQRFCRVTETIGRRLKSRRGGISTGAGGSDEEIDELDADGMRSCANAIG